MGFDCWFFFAAQQKTDKPHVALGAAGRAESRSEGHRRGCHILLLVANIFVELFVVASCFSTFFVLTLSGHPPSSPFKVLEIGFRNFGTQFFKEQPTELRQIERESYVHRYIAMIQ